MHKQILPVLVPLAACAAQPDNIPLPPEIELHKLRLEKRALEQAMDIVNPPNPCKCLGYTENELVACMDYADKHEVRQTFAHMSLHARIAYLMHMDLFAYKRFLDAFEHEKQWKETLATLPPEEQRMLPQTLLEQCIMIRDTWISCAERTVGMYAQGSKDPQAKDIAAWRSKTLERYEHLKKKCPIFLQWLNERFTEQKIKMLYKQ